MSEPIECLENDEACEGEVEYRHPLSGSGVSYPRCELHWNKRLDWQEEHNKKYPDSPCAPSWFDPSYAGECWDED